MKYIICVEKQASPDRRIALQKFNTKPEARAHLNRLRHQFERDYGAGYYRYGIGTLEDADAEKILTVYENTAEAEQPRSAGARCNLE